MKRPIGLIIMLACFLGSAGLRSEDVDVVSMDDTRPTATVTPAPTFTVSPTDEPTLVPTAVPAEAATTVTAESQGVSSDAQGKEKLDQPDFDSTALKGAAADGSDEGLVIIAPGAASPEDSFEAFGIESPFNWRERKRKNISGPESAAQDQEDAGIQLNTPETSDFKEKVDVENSQGEQVGGEGTYANVERAGFIVPADEFPMEGHVLREKNGQESFGVGHIFFMTTEAGRQIYPGSIYSLYRDMGVVSDGGDDPKDLGTLYRAVGIAKIIRVDSENTLVRVEKQYDAIRVGDGLRLREPDQTRYFGTLRQGLGEAPISDIKGSIVALQLHRMIAVSGDYVYLDIGKSAGVAVGMHFAVYRDPDTSGDPLNDTPGAVGRLGELEVLSIQKDSCTARIVKTESGLSIGDLIRYR